MSLFIINDYAAKYFQAQLTETEEGRTVGLAYFRERGIRPETIERFGLGYAPSRRLPSRSKPSSRAIR